MHEPASFAELLWGTVIYRPYVYGFLICFLFFALRHLRLKGCSAYLVLAYLIAFSCEYSSTRNGFPFGIYRYFDETRARELWISNIPFWDSLSFVFLSYFSWVLAASLRYKMDLKSALLDPATCLISGVLMMLLDVVIDPLTLLGDRWFLGRIYDYPAGGSYFGVTIANFAGWFFVGAVTPFAYRQLIRLSFLAPSAWRLPSSLELRGVFGVYCGVFLFNLGITAWIGQWTLLAASSAVVVLTLLPSAVFLRRRLLA